MSKNRSVPHTREALKYARVEVPTYLSILLLGVQLWDFIGKVCQNEVATTSNRPKVFLLTVFAI
jgi:hypothetical protein